MKALTLSIAALSLCGCMGKLSDVIRLSAHEITVDATAQTVVVTTESDNWIYDFIKYGTDTENIKSVPQSLEGSSINPVFDFDGLWFTVTNSGNRKSICVDLQENNTGKSRFITVSVWQADFYDRFTVTQLAE